MAPTVLKPAKQALAQNSPVRVLFFGPVRVKLGIAHDDIACAGEMTIEAFWPQLIQRHPQLQSMRTTVRLARNGEFLDSSAHVKPGDEIALIPPVSGG